MLNVPKHQFETETQKKIHKIGNFLRTVIKIIVFYEFEKKVFIM